MIFSAFPHVPLVPFRAPVDWLAPGGPMGAGNPTILGETETQVRAACQPWQPHKYLLMKEKEEHEKIGLKLNIHKTKIMVSGPITSWQIDEETMETMRDFILGVKITADGD